MLRDVLSSQSFYNIGIGRTDRIIVLGVFCSYVQTCVFLNYSYIRKTFHRSHILTPLLQLGQVVLFHIRAAVAPFQCHTVYNMLNSDIFYLKSVL